MDRSWWRILKKHGPLEKGMANHFNILALNPMNCMKREKAVKLKDEPPRSIGDQHATGEDQRNSSYEEAEPKQK